MRGVSPLWSLHGVCACVCTVCLCVCTQRIRVRTARGASSPWGCVCHGELQAERLRLSRRWVLQEARNWEGGGGERIAGGGHTTRGSWHPVSPPCWGRGCPGLPVTEPGSPALPGVHCAGRGGGGRRHGGEELRALQTVGAPLAHPWDEHGRAVVWCWPGKGSFQAAHPASL